MEGFLFNDGSSLHLNDGDCNETQAHKDGLFVAMEVSLGKWRDDEKLTKNQRKCNEVGRAKREV